MAAPAAAWDAHDLAHAAAPVGVGEHHHHDEDGAVVHEHEGGSDEDEGSGHDHMPSLIAGMSATLPVASLVPDARLEPVLLPIGPATVASGVSEPPWYPPPRTA